MDAHTFLTRLANALPTDAAELPKSRLVGDWTKFMTACLLRMAGSTRPKMHMCARNLPELDAPAAKRIDYMAQKFRYDMTIYAHIAI